MNKIDYFDDNNQEKQDRSKRKRTSGFFYFLMGLALGAFLFAVAFPKLIDMDWLPYQFYLVTEDERLVIENLSTNQEGLDQTNYSITPVSIDIGTQVTTIVEEVLPAVVGIENIKTDNFNFWDQAIYDGGTGSGVIYRKQGDQAFVVTNHHVIEGADQIDVILEDETRLTAEVRGTDLYTDLAVLEIDGTSIDVVIELGDSELTKVGEPVIAICNPLGFGLSGSVTQGIISGTQRSIPQDFSGDGLADWQADVIQTDAAINPGNSGGALFNVKGEVIGINSVKYSDTSVEGIGYAIPISDVSDISCKPALAHYFLSTPEVIFQDIFHKVTLLFSDASDIS